MECRRSRLSLVLVAALLLAGLPAPLGAQDGGALPGVTGSGYVSPTYGFALSWDESWQVEAATSAGAVDSLRLANGTSVVTLLAYPFAGDPTACVQARVAQLQTDAGVVWLEPAPGGDGAPLAGSDELGAYATHNYRAAEGGEERSLYLDCRPLVPGEAVLLIEQDLPRAAYNDQLEARRMLLATLVTVPTGADDEPSPAALSRSQSSAVVRWRYPALWSYGLTGLRTSVTVDDGVVYVQSGPPQVPPSAEGFVAALDLETGEERWQSTFTSVNGSVVSVGDGEVVVAGTDPATSRGNLFGLAADTGAVHRSWDPPAGCSPVVFAGDGAFCDVLEGDGAVVFGLDRRTGAERWQVRTGPLEAYPLPVAGGVVYVADTTGMLHALDAQDGDPIWSTDTGASGLGAPIVLQDRVVSVGYRTDDAGEHRFYLYAVAVSDGHALWELPAEDFASPTWTDGVLSFQDAVVDPDTGAIRRRFPNGVPSENSPAAADTIYMPSNEPEDGRYRNVLRAYDLNTGQERWTRPIPLPTGTIRGLTVSDGLLYAAVDNSLVAYDAALGVELWQVRTGGQITNRPMVAGGLVLVGSQDGYLYAVDPAAAAAQTGTGLASWDGRADEQVLLGTPVLVKEPVETTGVGLWRLTVDAGQTAYAASPGGAAYFHARGLLNSSSGDGGGCQDPASATFQWAFAIDGGVSYIRGDCEPIGLRNEGTTAGEVLLVALLPPEAQPTFAGGVSADLLGRVEVERLPPSGIAIELHRISLAPGAALPPQFLIWPEVVFVESGALRVTAPGGVLAIAEGPSAAPVSTSGGVVRSGGIAAVAGGSMVEVANADEGPLSFLVVEIWGADKYGGGLAGCGGRCLTFRSSSQ